MNGAQALLETLVGAGVEVCFTNPGTSEMHFVAALDAVDGMRAVLGLFEGVATGAADGYARVTGRPASVLLHLGPGLGNGLANLHNARKARVPVVTVVGDHATYHHQYDVQLESDIASVARNVSGWLRTSHRTREVGRDVAEAVAAARSAPGQVATLILPADVSWGDGGVVGKALAPHARTEVPTLTVTAVADALQGDERTVLFLGGSALQQDGLIAASRIAAATGARLLAETFPTRLERGAGLPAIDRLPYFAEVAAEQLADVDRLVLVDAAAPVSFFAYPNLRSELAPSGCTIETLAGPADDAVAALEAVAERVGAPSDGWVPRMSERPELPAGQLTADTAARVIGALLPEGAIVSDEANTSGASLPAATAGAPPHTWLTLTGGAIGQGLPLATGAAVAAPDRPVLALEADGSALYTIQALWTQARESLDVTTVIFSNRSYEILKLELGRVGAPEPATKAKDLFDLSRPEIDVVRVAEGLGVPASRATTAEAFADQLERALAEPGPHLVEAVVPGLLAGT